jgi:hypothetical protein
MFGKLQRTEEEAVVGYLKLISQYSPGGTEKNHSQDT